VIRRARADDLDAVAAVEAAGVGAWSRAQLDEEIRRAGGHALVALTGGRVVGYALGWAVAGEVHVLSIAVDPAARRQGLGRRLLDALIADCGGGAALLELRADNAAAWALYRGAGFRVVGRRPRYYADGEDALLMTRPEDA